MKKNHASQTDRGDPIERPVGFEEWRVYYKIVDFHGFDEKTKRRLLERESKRLVEDKIRFTLLSEDQYNEMEAGDTFTLNCQRFSDDDLMLWGALNHKKASGK